MCAFKEEDSQLFDRDMLERNITAYTYQWIRAVTNGVWGARILHHIDTFRNLFYQAWHSNAGWGRFGTYNLDTGAVIFESGVAANYIPATLTIPITVFTSNATHVTMSASHARYVVIVRNSLTDIEIWKDGALLQAINLLLYDPLMTNVEVLTMSQDGRWILVVTDLDNLICFRGD